MCIFSVNLIFLTSHIVVVFARVENLFPLWRNINFYYSINNSLFHKEKKLQKATKIIDFRLMNSCMKFPIFVLSFLSFALTCVFEC
jgi:hypothetical protein